MRISRSAESETRSSRAERDHEREVRDKRFFRPAFRAVDYSALVYRVSLSAPHIRLFCRLRETSVLNSSGVLWAIPEVGSVYFAGNALDSLSTRNSVRTLFSCIRSLDWNFTWL